MASSGYCFDNTGGGALVEGVNPTEIHQMQLFSIILSRNLTWSSLCSWTNTYK